MIICIKAFRGVENLFEYLNYLHSLAIIILINVLSISYKTFIYISTWGIQN